MATPSGKKWLDVSHFNSLNDEAWDDIAKNFDGVVLKATEGNTYKDPKFDEFYTQATKRKLEVMPYHFARFANEEDAVLEAQFHKSVIQGKTFYKNRIVLDLETNDKKLDKAALTKCADAFFTEIPKGTELQSICYSYPSFLKDDLEALNVPVWLADYSTDGKYYEELKGLYNIIMIQYTDKGHVQGSPSNFDLDIELVKEAPVKPHETNQYYVVKSGDNLTKIAQEFHTSVNALMALNKNIHDENIIFPGEKILIKVSVQNPTPNYQVTLPNIILREGSSGPAVKVLQTYLTDIHFNPHGIDGKYGPSTADAVRRFQSMFAALKDDGVYGPQTRKFLLNYK